MAGDFDFTSTGGNYFQHGSGPKPLDLPAVDWRARAEKAEARLREAEELLREVQQRGDVSNILIRRRVDDFLDKETK